MNFTRQNFIKYLRTTRQPAQTNSRGCCVLANFLRKECDVHLASVDGVYYQPRDRRNFEYGTKRLLPVWAQKVVRVFYDLGAKNIRPQTMLPPRRYRKPLLSALNAA